MNINLVQLMYSHKKHETYTRCSFNVNSDSIMGDFLCVKSWGGRSAQPEKCAHFQLTQSALVICAGRLQSETRLQTKAGSQLFVFLWQYGLFL